MNLNHCTVSERRVDQAHRAISSAVKHLGRAGFFNVVEELAFEWGIDYEGGAGKFKISLTDLQMVALAAALKAHQETVPSLSQ